MGGSALQHALEAKGLLWFSLLGILGQYFQILVEKRLQVALQPFDISTTLAEDIGYLFIKSERIENVF
jgi:hypothetical protein